jgi:hypothetical protein
MQYIPAIKVLCGLQNVLVEKNDLELQIDK